MMRMIQPYRNLQNTSNPTRIEFIKHVFRQTIQGSTETLDAYHTKLRGLAKFCDFHDADFEIKM